jgi:glycosyltransferase involved in cell wall biosynthesis
MEKKNINPRTILFFSSFGSLNGGGQRSLFYLVRGLDKTLFHPIVVCPEDGDLVAKLTELGVETLIMPPTRLRHISVFFVIRLMKLFRKRNVAIVDTDATTETFYAGIAARLTDVPLVWHIRVSNASFMDRILCLFSTKLVLVAKSLESRFPYLDAAKLAPITNGISIEEFDAVPEINIRKELGIGADAVLIGCIGRIEPMKGQEYLVRAVEITSRKTGNIHVLMVGEADETYLATIQDMIHSSGTRMFFSFLGHRTDAAGIIRNLDIAVSASSFGEGLSRVILEAIAAGKPVIGTDVGGAGEAILDGLTGYVIPPRDHCTLADVILKLAASREKREMMGAAGRRRVEESFSLAENIRKTERLYTEILTNED